MAYENIEFVKNRSIATIRLNYPPANVMNLVMIAELNLVLEEIHTDESIAAIVFSGGSQKHFSTGVDIKDHTLDKIELMLKGFHQIFRTLAKSDRITLAAVHGYCLGGGMELATFCDCVIATEGAVFGQPEIKVGCFPPVAAAWLPLIMNPKKAFEIAVFGENLSAQEAYDLGLVNQIVPENEFSQAVNHWCEKISMLSGAVLKKTKLALMVSLEGPFLKALDEAERIYLSELVKTEDIAEGIDAFMNKRKPEWRHR